MKLPSDGLTLKEVQEINGTPTSYKLNEPVQWAGFLAWPEDIQREYLEGLQSKYHVGLNEIASMMGAREASFSGWKRTNGIKSLFKGRSYPTPEWADFKARAAWLEQAPEPEPEAKPAPPVKKQEEREPENGPGEMWTAPGKTAWRFNDQAKRFLEEPLVKLKPEVLKRLEPEATLQRLLNILPALKASGAKIRIEVEL